MFDEAGKGDLIAIKVVGTTEVAMEVAEDGAVEGDAPALDAVGFDVATDGDFHFESPLSLPPGMGGWWLKSEWMHIHSESEFAKYKHPDGLLVNIRN
jgi:hypothetical protein